MQTKEDLRVWAKEVRKNRNRAVDEVLVQKLQETSEYKTAQNILLYYPLKDEINLLPLLNDSSKKFYLPKIEGKNLFCCSYKNGDLLCESCFKTKEPFTPYEDKNLINLAIIPALCVDGENFRLGYGGGFYDRFLKDFQGTKIVCIPKELVVETVFPEKHDIRMDLIITD